MTQPTIHAMISNDLTTEDILKDVCQVFDVPVKRVQTNSRGRELTRCRKICCYVAVKKTRLKLVDIAQAIGDRHHSTVIFHLKDMEGLLQVNDPSFMTDWNKYLENSTLFNRNDFR